MARDKKIFLITTKGCAGCEIMKDIIKQIADEATGIGIYIKDIIDCPQYIKVDVPLDDFPAIVFADGYDIKYYHIGTISLSKLTAKMLELGFTTAQ